MWVYPIVGLLFILYLFVFHGLGKGILGMILGIIAVVAVIAIVIGILTSRVPPQDPEGND